MNKQINTFNDYSKIYDLVNASKNYVAEVAVLQNLIDGYLPKKNGRYEMLEVGSGTGGHAKHLMRSYNLTCLEKSAEMAKICKDKTGLEVVMGEAENFSISNSFEIISAMFHVVNYLPDLKALDQFFKNCHKHLKSSGIIIFDTWHLPSVYAIGPSSRTIHNENSNFLVKRVSNSQHDLKRNQVIVTFEFELLDKSNNSTSQFTEVHHMRPWSYSEIEFFAEQNDLQIIATPNLDKSTSDPVAAWDTTFLLGKKK
jgi:SAM-dependent methyltransferase